MGDDIGAAGAPSSPMGSDGEGDGQWSSLFQGPAHEAGAFYNQIHEEIKALRGRVDQKLQDIIVSGKEDIDSLNKQVMSLKSTASSDGSGAENLPAIELVAGKVLNKSSKGPDDNSSFGDLRVSESAATEQAANLTRTYASRQLRDRYPETGSFDPSSHGSGISGVSESDNEDIPAGDDVEEEDSGVQYKQQQSQRLRPQRQMRNSKPPYSPNDAVAAARYEYATKDDAVTNARYGRASPPRRRFFPENPIPRKRVSETDEGKMSAMGTNAYGSASGVSQGRPQYETISTQSSDYGRSAYNQSIPTVTKTRSSSREDQLMGALPLGRTASEVQRSIISKPGEKDAPVGGDFHQPDPVPAAITSSRSFKNPHSAAASSSASTTTSDHFEIIVPSNQSETNASTKSKVSGLSTPFEVNKQPQQPIRKTNSTRSRASGRSYPAEVRFSPKSGSMADNRSEANISTKSRISGLSQPSSECFSEPKSDDLLLASLEFLDESRQMTSEQRVREQVNNQFNNSRPPRSTNGRGSRRGDVSGGKSPASGVSTSGLSDGSGLKRDEVDLLKASLAYLQCNKQLPTSPPSHMIHDTSRQRGSSGEPQQQQQRQSPTRPQRGGEDQLRQPPSYFHHHYQQEQRYQSLPEHLRPQANVDQRALDRQDTLTTLTASSYTKSRRSSQDLLVSEIRGEGSKNEMIDSTDQSISLQSSASKSVANKSATLASLASSSVTENMEVPTEHLKDSKSLLEQIEKEVGGVSGVVKIEKVQNHPITDPYGDTGRYTGLLVKGKPYGHGSMHYDDGRSYSGDWKNGRWNGKGRTLFVNGDFYVGEYAKDQRHGLGRYEWSDGRVYDGQFKRDRREGKGTYSWPDGAIYTGDFKSGHRHGQGCYKFKDGSVYTGEFKNGKYHGVGECVWADGRCYRGEWSEGHAHGYGVEMRPDGIIRHDGEWRKDRPIRKAKSKETVKDSNKKKSKGCKMPEGQRKQRKHRPTPGSSPRYQSPRRPPSPTYRRIAVAIDP